jgi:uncharacterized protein CbrC (UPF0167 family)
MIATDTARRGFVQDAEGGVDNQAKTDELFKRTPGYISWQGEYWLTYCGKLRSDANEMLT